MPTSKSNTTTATSIYGITDDYWCSNYTSDVYGVMHGGSNDNTVSSGALAFNVSAPITYFYAHVGCRTMLC